MRGKEWTAEAQAMIERRVPDAEIVKQTGCSLRNVQEHRRALGLKAFAQREGWTRRMWLLHDAAGLDFQM